MLTNAIENKLNGNYTRMLRAELGILYLYILWRDHTTNIVIYEYNPPIRTSISTNIETITFQWTILSSISQTKLYKIIWIF